MSDCEGEKHKNVYTTQKYLQMRRLIFDTRAATCFRLSHIPPMYTNVVRVCVCTVCRLSSTTSIHRSSFFPFFTIIIIFFAIKLKWFRAVDDDEFPTREIHKRFVYDVQRYCVMGKKNRKQKKNQATEWRKDKDDVRQERERKNPRMSAIHSRFDAIEIS